MWPAGWGDLVSISPVVRSSSGVASRIADTLLAVVGGRTVQLRMAKQPSPGDGGQLGQPSPGYQDYPLAPVVFRKIRPTLQTGEPNKYELLISSTAVTNLLATLPASSPQALFLSALGVLADTQLLLIEGVGTSEAFGAAYLFTLTLRDQ